MFSSLRTFHTFHSSCTILCSHQQHTDFSFFTTLQHYFWFFLFDDSHTKRDEVIPPCEFVLYTMASDICCISSWVLFVYVICIFGETSVLLLCPFLLFFFFSCCVFETGSYYIALTVLELTL